MRGPNVHAFADISDGHDGAPGESDTDVAQPSEEVDPGDPHFPFVHATDGSRTAGGCDPLHLCSWDSADPRSWQTPGGGDQWKANVVQTFWYANHFHDHLAQHGPGFTASSGSFEGDDPLSLNALDGAGSAADGGPDANHVDNANMLTPADGESPRMQMYLFEKAAGSPFRDINGGDDAAVLYHEYTHGLTSRLVTNDDGTQALNTPHAGAMGEGWSDWYAQDLLVREGLVTDTPGIDGEIDMGRYTDSTPRAIRRQAVDCAVGSTDAAACPASPAPGTAGPGGFTLGDFGKVRGRPEVHSDGEIWAQTLWEVRQQLVARLGEAVGSDTAERIITDAMRLSIPEPSFLDMRNAILAADLNDTGGVNATLLWDVFARRGMGFYAGVVDSSDVAPAEDFAAPPRADAPTGTIAGQVLDARTKAPLDGVTTGIGGLATRSTFTPYFAARTGADGRYTLGGVPQGTYPKVSMSRPGYDKVVKPITVGPDPITYDNELVRDWIASSGGARLTTTNDASGDPYGCGAAAVIDQSQGAGWSALNTTHRSPAKLPTAVYELPVPVTVERFGVDPSNTCGDDISSTAKDYTIETSRDGASWTIAYEGHSTRYDAKQLKSVDVFGGPRAGVKFIRLTLKSPLDESAGGAGQRYIDFSELEVYGIGPNQVPTGRLTASPASVPAGGTVTFDASSFTDPDGRVAAYDWDFDGDGQVDATTTTPTAASTYARTGSVTVSVAARDFVGGTGRASTVIAVTATPNVKLKAKPSLVLPRRAGKGRVKFRATCRDTCRIGAELRVSAKTRRRLHLRSVIVGRLATRTFKGTRTLSVVVTQDARKRMLRRHTRTLNVSLRISAVVPGDGGSRRKVAKLVGLTL
jgi:PKD repeat protein